MKEIIKKIVHDRKVIGLALFIGLYIAGRMIYWLIWSRHGSFGPEPVVEFLKSTETWFTYHFFTLFGLATATSGNLVSFTSGETMAVWDGCSGSGEMIKALVIFLVYPGPWRHKLWFIPAMLVFIYLAALVHLFLLGFILALRPEWFEWGHSWGTRIVFYGMFFLIWVFWENKIRGKSSGNAKEGDSKE